MKSFRATSAIASQLSATRCSQSAIAAPQSLTCRSTTVFNKNPKRTFFGNPFGSGVQSLTATRTLPYPSDVLYDIISDVPSYHSFVPFCQSSTITKFTEPDSNGKRWPEEGKLVVGFNNDINESFYSRIYCVPGQVVEAVSGATETSLSADQIAHHSPRPSPDQDPSRNANVLTHLMTRWTLRPFHYKPGPTAAQGPPQQNTSPIAARPQTEVTLVIDYAFANPVYGALSAAAAPKVADKMIQAFETRVKSMLDQPSTDKL